MSARFPTCDAANCAARVLRAMSDLCPTFLLPIGATLLVNLTDRSSIKWVFSCATYR